MLNRAQPASSSLRVVALAASSGGLAALTRVLSALPADFPAAVLVVQHLVKDHPSLLAEILRCRILLPVEDARGGERLTAGRVFLAPPDHHLIVGPDGVLSLTQAPPVHFVRPSADVLFASIADSVGPGGIAVVLTGTGCDGADGVIAVKSHGGLVIVQDEATSAAFGMPGAAFATGSADRVLPLAEIAPALVALVGSGAAV
jgi:two-component system chemotaxis response regulator CheB